MNIRLVLAAVPAELDEISHLYLTAFPPEERRTFEEFKKQFEQKKCFKVYLAKNGSIIQGFINLWTFDDFAFIEHFAVMPTLRGQNIGQKILNEIRSVSDQPILLETELPVNDISTRRIRFYQRNGFHLLDKHYVQPSYDGITPGPELKLMSTAQNPGNESLEQMIETIRRNVYDCR